jgi:hypothetical protein
MAEDKRKPNCKIAPISWIRSIELLSVFVLAALFSACGSATETNTAATNSNSANRNSSNVVYGQPVPGNSNPSNFNGANVNVDRPMNAEMQRLEQIRANANKAGSGKIPSVNERPAPEDSTISATLTDVAREVRTWKHHPLLSKVEKIYDGGDGKIKVYLKNGKVIDLPGSSITQLGQVSSATVLSLAGISQDPPQESKSRSTSAAAPPKKP